MSTPCEITELELQALSDGELPAERARELEAHAETCEHCRRFLDEERALAARVAALPRAIAPAPEVWRAIEARIGEPQLRTAAPRALKTQTRWRIAAGGFALAAAAVLTIVAAHPGKKPVATVVPVPPAPVVPAPEAPKVVELPEEAPYLAALVTMEADFTKSKSTLPADAARTVEENLRTIDTAIATMRTTLSTAPDDLDLKSQLATLYQQKIRVETDVIDLATRI